MSTRVIVKMIKTSHSGSGERVEFCANPVLVLMLAAVPSCGGKDTLQIIRTLDWSRLSSFELFLSISSCGHKVVEVNPCRLLFESSSHPLYSAKKRRSACASVSRLLWAVFSCDVHAPLRLRILNSHDKAKPTKINLVLLSTIFHNFSAITCLQEHDLADKMCRTTKHAVNAWHHCHLAGCCRPIPCRIIRTPAWFRLSIHSCGHEVVEVNPGRLLLDSSSHLFSYA